MKVELQDLQPMLEARSEETAVLTKVIEKESVEVEEVKKNVQKDEAAATEAAMSSKGIKVTRDLLSHLFQERFCITV